jgi:subtilisin family serine protease
MMEIVQDMCPNSQVYFATAFTSEASFASNILALGAAGCRVVVDDVSYDDEFPFQDGVIAQAVNSYVASGGIYFSSAANDGSKTFASATVWEGDFNDGGPYTIPPLSSPRPTPSPTPSASSGYTVHNFGTSASPVLSNQLLQQTRAGILFWADPIGMSSNDYDLFITNSTGSTLKGFSIDTQNGGGDPIEEVVATSLGGNWVNNAANDRLVVVKKSTAQVRAIRVESLFGESLLAITTPGATRGHNAGQNTQSCAATFWNSARIGTKPFNGTNNPTEPFSSDGPRKIFFNPNGTPITPGNFLFATNGGLTLQKPDFTAADGVTTKTPGFNPFYGTSAAAPHAAAIAALVISARPALTNTQVSAFMHSTALDNMAPGADRDGGVGVVMAAQAVQAAQAAVPPSVRPPLDKTRAR